MGAVAERKPARALLSDTANLVLLIVQELVNVPEDVEVVETAGEQTTLLEVRCHPEDIKHVIGRNGVTAEAIRHLLACLGAKERRDFVFKVLEARR